MVPGGVAGWVGTGGARIDGSTVRYTLTNAVATRIRPRQPTEPLPVLATPRLAAAADDGGLLPLQIAGERLTVRIVGTVGRFPGVDGQAVVGDGDALSAAVNLERPGAGRVNEVWDVPANATRAGLIAGVIRSFEPEWPEAQGRRHRAVRQFLGLVPVAPIA